MNRWIKFGLRFALYAGLGLILAYMSDWLPVSEGAKRVLTRLWGPVLTVDYPTAGRDKITVLVADDTDLREYDEVWPVSLGFHQRRLQELLKFQPKAVFFDIVFLDDRKDPDLDGFIDAACRARLAGVPVFIGSVTNAGIAQSRTERAMLGRHVEVGGRSMPCIEAAYLNLRIDGFDQSVWEYDLAIGAHGVAHDGAPQYLSPAARLYAVDHRLDPTALQEPMALVWGTAPDPLNLEWLNSDLRAERKGATCASTWHWYRVLPIGKAGPPLCPYQQLLPLRTLKGNQGLSAADLRAAIEGKYIIYGTNLQSSADLIVSPYHGHIAGAFLHAMALDNLLSFEGAPKAAGEFGHPWNGRATWFITIAVVVISAFLALKSLQDRKSFKEHWEQVQRQASNPPARLRQFGPALWAWSKPQLVVGAMGLAIIGALIFISYYWLALGPLVWIEYALFPFALEMLHVGEKIEHRWDSSKELFKELFKKRRAPHAATEDAARQKQASGGGAR